MDIVDLLIVVAGVLPVAVFRDLRTTRAILFVSVLAVMLLAAASLPEPVRGAIKIAVIWSYVVVFLWFQHVLAGRSAAEARIDKELRRIAADADRMVRAWPADLEAARARRESILNRIGTLEPPNRLWSRVIELQRTYYGLLLPLQARETVLSPSTTSPELDRIKQEIGSAWEEALRPGNRARR